MTDVSDASGLVEPEPVLTPQRIQRKRSKGWKMPEGAVYVGRPSRWGNPYLSGGFGCSPESAVALFVDMLQRAPLNPDGTTQFDTIKRALAGKDLACWCPLSAPCHADVLLELANTPSGGDR